MGDTDPPPGAPQPPPPSQTLTRRPTSPPAHHHHPRRHRHAHRRRGHLHHRMPASAADHAARARAYCPGRRPAAAPPPPAAPDALPRRARAGARVAFSVVLWFTRDLAVAPCDLRDWEGRAAVCEGRADAADACAGGRWRARRALMRLSLRWAMDGAWVGGLRPCCDTPVSVYLLPVQSDMILPHAHAASCSLIMICPSGSWGAWQDRRFGFT